ncbi:MAG: hypothetical protein HY459_00360 [Parcubacteria group bacterium]|nr:hypothetical protein [Parcubacteria group bacterium]
MARPDLLWYQIATALLAIFIIVLAWQEPRALLTLLITELVLGGSGRMILIGGVLPFRSLLLILAPLSAWRADASIFHDREVLKATVRMTAAVLIGMILLWGLYGYFQGNEPSRILADIDGFSGLLLIPWAWLILKDPSLTRFAQKVGISVLTILAVVTLLLFVAHSIISTFSSFSLLHLADVILRERLGVTGAIGITATNEPRVLFVSSILLIPTVLYFLINLIPTKKVSHPELDSGSRMQLSWIPAFAGMTLLILALLVSRSRGLFLGTATAFATTFGLLTVKRWVKLVAAILVIAIGLLIIGEALREKELLPNSTRFLQSNALITEIAKRPLFGAGFGATISDPMGSGKQLSIFELGYHDLAFKTGLVGLLLWFGLMGILWWRGVSRFRIEKDEGHRYLLAVLLGTSIAFAVMGIFNPVITGVYNIALLGLLAVAIDRNDQKMAYASTIEAKPL